ncbi:MAG: DUF4040 domain-containing protein [Chloroflexi bacterium]|nr:DUF4040 domain-containing protein [Chloroflexota bacterium]
MELILLVLALPVLLALGTLPPVLNRWPDNFPNPARVVTGAMVLMFVILLAVAYQPVIVEQGAATLSIDWVPQYNLNFSIYLDSLALLFGLIVTGIGAVVFFYTGEYFEDAEERDRFMRLLLLFTFAMLWLVLSGNLITLFIAWELTSIISFLLIGFKGDKYASAREGAARSLIVTGGGGLALLVGILLLGAAGGTYELSELLTLNLADHIWYVPIALLVMIGAFTKSAQFPFHFWLPGAMDAPTPASAFLHSATMVKAGIYLLARLHPVLSDAALWTSALLLVGLTTYFLTSLIALRQQDLKGVLAFTTTAKLGALVALLGVPEGYGMKAALIGIVAHALYKSALFLSVGTIDHATGTRLVSKLGGLWSKLPTTGVIVIISSLSMAGLIPLLGFVSKETLLEAFAEDTLWLVVAFAAATLSATAGYILIWDVFFGKQKMTDEEMHFHAPAAAMERSLLPLAGGTVVFALLVTPLFTPLFTPLIPVDFYLVLFPGFNEIFLLSLAALGGGAALFFARNLWRGVPDFPVSARRVYEWVIGSAEWIADQALKTQNGKLRHYLIAVLSVSMGILLYGGVVRDLFSLSNVDLGGFTVPDILDIMLLVLAVGAAWASVRVHQHLYAALALGIFGYAIAGIFFVEPAPDVALVQFLVETLATVVLVVMISRVSAQHRRRAMLALRRPLSKRRDATAEVRDIAIAVVTGVCMFAFSFVALTSRDNRESIAAWHLANAEPQVGVTDVVSAILTDFRGTDTLVEIAVFAVAALGVLALLTINRQEGGEPNAVVEGEAFDSLINTPLLRTVATIVLPITLVVAAVHVLYGADAPGDGFTAGIVSGLGVTLYYVVFGYYNTREQFSWLRPARVIGAGLLLALGNGILPMLSGGAFMGLIDFAPDLNFANLKFTTTVVFELAIAITVFGGVTLIMETIAHPEGIRLPNEPTTTQTIEAAPTAAPVLQADAQAARGDD